MTGKVRNMSTYPNGFMGGVAIKGMPVMQGHQGKVFWVGNGDNLLPNERNASDGNKGTELDPFATWDYAVEQCAANRGDLIIIKAGHSESLSSQVVMDVEGVTVIGLGSGDNRPQYTVAVEADGVDVEAENCTIAGLYFPSKSDDLTTAAKIDVDAQYFTAMDCYFDQGENDLLNITLTDEANYATFERCVFESPTDSEGDSAIELEGVIDGLRVIDCEVRGTVALDEAVVVMNAHAATNSVIQVLQADSGLSTIKSGSADVNTLLLEPNRAYTQSYPIEITQSAVELQDESEGEAFVIEGPVEILGVYGTQLVASNEAEDLTLTTESGRVLMANTDLSGQIAVGDQFGVINAGAAGTLAEVGAETPGQLLYNSPVLITGTEDAVDTLSEAGNGTEAGHVAVAMVWRPLTATAEVTNAE